MSPARNPGYARGVTNIVLIISWILVGALFGGIGLTGIASAVGTGPRGDIGTAVGLLLTGVTLGAIAGGLLGRVLQQAFAGHPRKLNLSAGAAWIAGLVLVLGVAISTQLRERPAEDDLKPDGRSAWLIYQVRLPPGAPAPAQNAVVQEFRTEKETRKQSFPGHDVHVERVGDRVVIQGNFESHKTAQRRVIRLRIGDGATHAFVLKLLPPRPPLGYAKAYSEWHGADQVEEADKPPRPPLPSEALEIRYKMDVM